MATLGDQLRIALDLAAKEEELTPTPAKPRSSTALGRGVANLADYIAFGVDDKSVVPIQGLARTQAERPQDLKDYEERIATEARKWSEAEGIGEKAGVVAKTAGAALSEPGQLGSFVAEQAPNAIPSIAAGAAGKALGGAAGRWAGAKLGGTVGAALGPVGAGVGAIIGMAGGGFLTDYLAEKASGVLKEVQDPTDPREVWRVINDKQIMDEKESEAFRHATGVTGVDLLTAIITRGVVGRGGIANALKGLGIETVGEGAGEAAGQLHAYGKIDPAEVALETIGGFAQSAGTTALFYEAKDPNLKEAQKTATDWSKVDPTRNLQDVKPDYTKIRNPLRSNREQQDAVYENQDIAKAVYNLDKANQPVSKQLVEGPDGKLIEKPVYDPRTTKVADEYVEKLTADYILSTKADPAARQEAIDALQDKGYGDRATQAEELFKQRMAEEEAKKQAQEQAKLEKEKKKAEAKQQAEELKAKNEERKAQGKKPLKPKKAKKEAEPAPVVEEPVKTEEEVKQEVIETVFKKEEPVRTTTAAEREAGLKKAREEGRRDLPGTNMGELDPFGQPKETNIPIRTPEDIKRAAEKIQGTTKEVAGEVVQEPTITPKIDPESVYDSEDPVAIQDMLVNAGISPSNAPVLSGMRWMDLPQKVKDTLTQTYGTQAQREEKLTQLDQQVQQQFDKDNPLPANAYGGTHGKGYKSRPTGTAITSLNKKYGGADKYTFREFKGKWYVIPKEGVVALDEKKKGPSAPKTAYADKIQVGQPFTPAGAGGTPLFAGRRENIRGTFNLTGQVMKTQEGNWVMENIKEDGTSEWISPNAFGETQEFIKKRLEPDRKTHKQLAKAEEIQKNIVTIQEKKPHLANLSDENLNDILTEAKNISEIQNGEVRAKVIKKVTERLSTKLGGPVSMADIINIAAANREGFLAAQPTRGVAPQPVAEATPAPVPVQETAPVVEPAPQTPQSPIEETYPEPTPEEKAAQDEIAKGFTSLRDALLKSGLVKAPQSPVEAVTEATPTPTTPTPVETPTEAPVASPKTIIANQEANKEKTLQNIATNEKRFNAAGNWEYVVDPDDQETRLYDPELGVFDPSIDDYLPFDEAPLQLKIDMLKKHTALGNQPVQQFQKTESVAIDETVDEDVELREMPIGGEPVLDEDMANHWNALPSPRENDWLASGRKKEGNASVWRPSNERKPVDIPAITNLANAIFDKIRQNVKDLDLVVYRTAEDLAKYPGLRDKLFNADGTGTSANEAQGYFIKKTSPSSNGKNIVVLNANKFISAKFTEMTILHEVVGHYGLRKLLGPRWESFVDKIIDTNPKAVLAASKLIPRWRKLYLTEGNMYHGVPAFSNKAKEGYVKVSEGNESTYINKNFMSQMIDEYLAEEAAKFVNKEYQDKQVKNFLQRAIAYVRHILRSIIGGKEAQSVTDEDIAGLLSESYIRTMGDPAQAMTAYEADMETQRFRQTKFAQNDFYAESTPTVAEEESNISYAAPLDPPSPMSVDLLHDQWKAPQSQLAWLNQWREGVDHTFKKISRMKGMGWVLPHKIAGENYFKDLMYKTQGTIRRIEMTTRPAAKWLGKLAKEDPTTMGKITTTWLEGGDFNTIPGLSKMQVNSLEKTRNELEIAQQGLNALGYLDDFKYEASKGKYLHTVFISMANEFQGAGKTPSLMKYLEKRKTDPEAKAFLGINRNPEFAIPNTVGMVARDVALLQLMDGIKSVSEARNLGWVLDGGGQKINVRDVPGLNKKSVTYPNLLRYLDQTNELLKSANIKSRGATAEDVATLEAARKALEQKVMEARSGFHASIKEQMIKSGHPYAELDAAGNVVRMLQKPTDSEVDFFLKQNYVRVDGRKNPNLKPFHNKYVHKDIYNEFVNMQDMIEGEVGGASVKQLWKDMTQQGGLLEKLTAIWKQTKTGLNIPVYYMRNTFGNWWLLDTTTDTPSHKLMGMLIDEAKQTISGEGKKIGGKTYKEWAEEYGLYATTYGSAELYVLRENFLDKIRIAEAKEEKKWIKYAGLQFKDTFLTLSEMTANFNGLLEGIFKQTSMRDYVERWEKRTGRNFNQLTAQEQSAVMSGAARQANDSIFDYQNVPAWLKQLRRIPLGTPFLTFNYYVAAHLPKAMLKHPWKMAKYYALPMMMMSAALELGFDDEEEEDYKKALESLPWYYRNNASHIVTPFKDKNGKYQVYDFTYMFPPAMFTNAYLKLANPSMGETTAGAMHDVLTKDLGLLGGPVPQAISAILSNKNPFNDRDISVPGDLTEKNIERWLTFFYTLAMPPVITETGFLGRTLDQAGIDLPMISTGQQLNKYGSDKETMAQTALRLTGVSPIGFSPQESQRANLAKYQYHLQNIQKARANALKDRNKSLEDRQQVAKEYAQKIRELNAEYRALRGE